MTAVVLPGHEPLSWIAVLVAATVARLLADRLTASGLRVLRWVPAGAVLLWLLAAGEIDLAARLFMAILVVYERRGARTDSRQWSLSVALWLLIALSAGALVERFWGLEAIAAGFALAEGYRRVFGMADEPRTPIPSALRTIIPLFAFSKEPFVVFAAAILPPDDRSAPAPPFPSGAALILVALAVLTRNWGFRQSAFALAVAVAVVLVVTKLAVHSLRKSLR